MSTTTIVNANAFLNALKALAAASFLVLVAGLASCNNASTPTASTDSEVYALTLPNVDNSPSVVADSGLDKGCRMDRPESDHHRIDDFGSRLLRRLNLTDTQKTQVVILVQQHEDCSKLALGALRSSDSLIFASFKPRFDSIRTDLAAGTIDNATARQRFHDLKQELRTALQNNPDRATAQTALKACHDTFIANLRAILTTDQQAILDQWLATHK